MAASESLFQALAQALSQPSKAYRAAQAGLEIPEHALKGYERGADLANKFRQRKLAQQTLRDVLGANVPERFSKVADIPQEQIEGFGGLKNLGDETGLTDIQKEMLRDTRQERALAARDAAQQRALDAAEKRHADTLGLMRDRLAAPKEKVKTDKDVAFNLYETARDGLMTALENTTTGPIAGRLPALTANQQTADSAVAAMAPVLKQLFRVAGEGVFTDRDQELLLKMVATRVAHPEARRKLIANVDNIVKAKLGMAGGQGSGNKVKVSNGTETRMIDPNDIPNAAIDGYKPVP